MFGAVRNFLDPLTLVIASQAAFLTYGISFLDFNVDWLDVLAAVASAVATEFIFVRLTKGTSFSLFVPKSAIAAALGIGLFFRASDPVIFAACSALAIASKYLIRRNGRHLFNPSNIAILAFAFAFPHLATIELTQWGNNPYLYVAVAVVVLAVSLYSRVWPTTLSFLVSYIVLLIPSVGFMSHMFAPHHLGVIGPSLVLFAAYMITDPKTSPQTITGRVFHGASVAMLYFSLEAAGVTYSIFLASFGVALLNAVFAACVPRAREFLRSTNVLSLAVIGCLLMVVMTAVWNRTSAHSFTMPSATFLLFGIERGVIASCHNPTFKMRTDVGLPFGSSNSVTHASWGDFDNDGYDDVLLIVNLRPRLYRNNGATFTEVTEQVGIAREKMNSAYFADYNDDGLLDLFTSDFEKLKLYENVGGKFVDVTHGALNMTFADLDGDGDLDFVTTEPGNRVELEPHMNVAMKKQATDPVGRSWAGFTCNPETIQTIFERHPNLEHAARNNPVLNWHENQCLHIIVAIDVVENAATFPPTDHIVQATLVEPGSTHLYENVDGVYKERLSFAATVQSIFERSRNEVGLPLYEGLHPYGFITATFFQPVTFDYNADGLQDIFIAVDNGSNVFLQNMGALRFEAVTEKAALNYLGSGMGADVADFDRDGDFDIVVSNVRRDFIFRNNGNGTFTNEDAPDFGSIGLGWGISFLDYDGDGWEDVFVANGDMKGHYENRGARFSRPLFRRDNLYRNQGDGTFYDITSETICDEYLSGYATAVSDYDMDGDPDILIGNMFIDETMGSGAVLYQNEQPKKNFVRVRLHGSTDNSFGIGSIVTVAREGDVQRKALTIGSGFKGQNSMSLYFGLGMDSTPVSILVRWPSGRETFLDSAEINRTLDVFQQ
jgi:Na+-translocating ferredoxin:NAD+ oxidoreductase RnfD subunit